MPSSLPTCAPAPGVLPALLAMTQAPQTMLLVEDSRFAAETVRLICRGAGIRLRRAETLEAARRHLAVYRPELALVDLGLPDGSGLELIAELARVAPRRPRIVAVSGDPDGRAAALAAGADAFCAKPLDLAAHLDALLGPGAAETARARVAALRAMDPPAAGRNGGADPMALHDDLKRAHALLLQGRRVPYAARFVAGIARSLQDASLTAAADQALGSGHRRPLMAALVARLSASPAI